MSDKTFPAPAGGLRVNGKVYDEGSPVPDRYRANIDPAYGATSTPPNFGRPVLPNAITFSGIFTTLSKTYRMADEAVRDSKANANAMLKDPSITAPLFVRQKMVSLLNYHIETEDDNHPKLAALKSDLTKIVRRTSRFAEYKRSLLSAIWYGRSAVQNQYRIIADRHGKSRAIIGDWKPINGDKLLFRYDDGTGTYDPNEIGVRVTSSLAQRDRIGGDRELESTHYGRGYFLKPWERSLLTVHKHLIMDAPYEEPEAGGMIHGVGLRHFLYWVWYQKQETLAQIVEMVERSGAGFMVYRYPTGNPQAKAEVEAAAERQGHTNVILIPVDPMAPDATDVQQVPPNTQGISVLHDLVDDYFGDIITRTILGQTLSQKTSATGMNSGVSDLHADSLFQVIRYDAVNLEETLTKEFLLPLIRYNFPAYQNVEINFRITTESVSAEQKLAAIRQIYDMGGAFRLSDVMDIVGMTIPNPDEPQLRNPQGQMPPSLGAGGTPGDSGAPGVALPGVPEGAPPEPDQQTADARKHFGPLMDDDPAKYTQRSLWNEDDHPRDAAGRFARADRESERSESGGPSVLDSITGPNIASPLSTMRQETVGKDETGDDVVLNLWDRRASGGGIEIVSAIKPSSPKRKTIVLYSETFHDDDEAIEAWENERAELLKSIKYGRRFDPEKHPRDNATGRFIESGAGGGSGSSAAPAGHSEMMESLSNTGFPPNPAQSMKTLEGRHARIAWSRGYRDPDQIAQAMRAASESELDEMFPDQSGPAPTLEQIEGQKRGPINQEKPEEEPEDVDPSELMPLKGQPAASEAATEQLPNDAEQLPNDRTPASEAASDAASERQPNDGTGITREEAMQGVGNGLYDPNLQKSAERAAFGAESASEAASDAASEQQPAATERPSKEAATIAEMLGVAASDTDVIHAAALAAAEDAGWEPEGDTPQEKAENAVKAMAQAHDAVHHAINAAELSGWKPDPNASLADNGVEAARHLVDLARKAGYTPREGDTPTEQLAGALGVSMNPPSGVSLWHIAGFVLGFFLMKEVLAGRRAMKQFGEMASRFSSGEQN